MCARVAGKLWMLEENFMQHNSSSSKNLDEEYLLVCSVLLLVSIFTLNFVLVVNTGLIFCSYRILILNIYMKCAILDSSCKNQES